ncbi:NAD(P)H-hydrate dehydratase [Sediminibacterium soli]|uniref:NAD(P)H-hydrate dehydratase n=1 Tax=Sediminibacterium soli TaxID=2698829 RepID=UPI00137B554F|nr:NAD(P)H-hydrate dehydratase [Sediminibacterium soli]NCI46824.1 NAD(P)H-hydrate dehydratase [Sediminibacterium soli]
MSSPAEIPADLFPGIARTELHSFLEKETNGYRFLSEKTVRQKIQPRDPAAYKHQFGHALIIAGSEGKGGAAVLCAKAALRTGCGLVTAWVPRNVQQALLVALPEAMTLTRNAGQDKTPDLSVYQSIGFGPGAGMDAAAVLRALLPAERPLVIDADGLTLLSQDRQLYMQLSDRVVLTPHAGEFDRLTAPHASAWERLHTQIGFSKKYATNLLLKGRYTSVTMPDGSVCFITSGNSGMATAGSGDVLTGIITSLLAQGYAAADAACIGACIHGAAGDMAAAEISMQGLIASDITEALGKWFAAGE